MVSTSRERERPATEIVFHLLKTLMMGHLVWGAHAGVKLSELCTILSTSETRLRLLLQVLLAEGLIAGDDAGTIWLTPCGARYLACEVPGVARDRVEFLPAKWQ